MKIYICLLIVISCFTASGCNVAKKTIDVDVLKGYFVKNTVEDTDNFQCFVFTDKDAFLEICGQAATMSVQPTEPDFTKNIVITVVAPKTNKSTSLKIERAELEKGTVIVIIESKVAKEELSYTMRPAVMAAIGKTDVNTVVFRINGQDIAVKKL